MPSDPSTSGAQRVLFMSHKTAKHWLVEVFMNKACLFILFAIFKKTVSALLRAQASQQAILNVCFEAIPSV